MRQLFTFLRRPRPSGARLRWTPPWRDDGDPKILSEYLRVIYQDYTFSSPIVAGISLYLYTVWPERHVWLFLDLWMVCWVLYLLARFVAGFIYTRNVAHEEVSLRVWSPLSVWIAGLDGVFVSLLGLFVYPELDPMAQVAVLCAVLVLVGATAFSLSGRWVSVAVYAPGVYLSFAWSTWQQTHPYAHGFAIFTLVMFGLYLSYAANQRRSLRKGFDLAKLNGELARELQVKNAELQEVALARSRLLATVSHDLRQPAHAIGLLAERALVDPSPQSLQQNLLNLDELSQSLSASLTTLMDLTRLDAGLVQPNPSAVPLSQVLLRLEAEFTATARNRGLELVVPVSDLWVRSDPVLLHGVLANLVSNAVKYTRRGSVRIEVQAAGGSAWIGVRDTGLGIHRDKLELIFKEFVRLDASEAGTEGLGLGLSIVRRYASLLGHRLTVESTVLQGSRFAIEVPVVADPPRMAPVQAGRAAQDSRLSRLRVLVVDNMDMLLESMERTIRAWGCEVHTARNLDDARQVARAHSLDLVITDFHLGDREPNGLLLIEVLRQLQPAGRTLPCVLMTGDVSAQLEAQASRQGVRILHKPVRPAVLQNVLLDMLPSTADASRP